MEKDPYRAQENHEANQGSLRNKNHECVFSSFSHTQITYKFLMAALVLSGANTYHAYIKLCPNKKE